MKRNNILLFIIFILIILLFFLLIHNFGYIDNVKLVPTGNIDIFDIECDNECDCKKNDDKTNPSDDEDKPVFKEEDNNTNITVSDDYSVWGSKILRIFSNPAYEYESKLAPGSQNSYTFVIRNNNSYDITVDVSMVEENLKNINMMYKLSSNGEYLVGDTDTYASADKLNLKNITIKSKSYVSYNLDWKWVDSDNDTEIGLDPESNYKLTINIGANQILE